MGVWTTHVVPRMTDASLKGHEIGELRREVCAPLTGRVLEIGFGSGLNARWYPRAVTGVAAVEPSDVGWRLSERRRAGSAVPVERRGLDGQRLDEPDAAYDSALTTFTLCTVPDPARALLEVRRVLRPGGVVGVLEHGLSPDPAVARRQHRFDPVQRRLAGGCHLSRDIPGLLADAGLEVTSARTLQLPGPRFSHAWTHVFVMTARAPG